MMRQELEGLRVTERLGVKRSEAVSVGRVVNTPDMRRYIIEAFLLYFYHAVS